MCWTKLAKQDKFVNLFADLGKKKYLGEPSLKDTLYLCFLYGYPRLDSVNDVRKAIFWKRFEGKEGIVDLYFLPTCQMNLKFHIQRSNYVAHMSRYANQVILDLDNPAIHAQNEDMSIKWESYCIPRDLHELLQPSSTDDVAESIGTDEYPEKIDFGDEDSNVEEDMEYESDNEN